MIRLKRVVERGYKQGIDFMRPYTNPLWNKVALSDDCLLVDNFLAVPIQLRPALMKIIHRRHPRQEELLKVSRYLW